MPVPLPKHFGPILPAKAQYECPRCRGVMILIRTGTHYECLNCEHRLPADARPTAYLPDKIE